MNKNKPIIGVTGPDKGGTAAWLFTWFSVALQGGKAIRIRPSHPKPSAQLDGLILGGGADIDPARYGQSLSEASFKGGPKPKGLYQWFIRLCSFLLYPVLFCLRKVFSTKSPAVDTNRDELEFGLLKDAISRNIPILGICRGSQLINVYFGGDLHQDIGNFYGEIPQVHSIWPRKKVMLESKSRLYSIIGSDCIWVNALHHQTVNKEGGNLAVVAKEDIGLAQAIEHSGYRFLIGIQWHPEYMPQIPEERAIFKEFVKMAKEGKGNVRV